MPTYDHSNNPKLLQHICMRGCIGIKIPVQDPRNIHLVGLPPRDMLQDVEDAWRAAGLDVDKCWENAVSVTSEWVYTRGPQHISQRIVQKRIEERRIPLKHRSLAETLNPMPRAAKVIHELLLWIDSCDEASQRNEQRPPFRQEIFDEDLWWSSLNLIILHDLFTGISISVAPGATGLMVCF